MTPEELLHERTVLGAAVLYPGAFALVSATVAEADFGSPEHRQVWRALAALAPRHDLVALADYMADHGLIDGALSLTCDAPAPHLVEAAAQLVQQNAQRRALADQLRTALHRVENGDAPEDVARDCSVALTRLHPPRVRWAAR